VAASFPETAGRSDDLACLPARRRHARQPPRHRGDPVAAPPGSPAGLAQHPVGAGKGWVPRRGRDPVPV